MQHHLKKFYTKIIIRYFKKMSHLKLQFTDKRNITAAELALHFEVSVTINI